MPAIAPARLRRTCLPLLATFAVPAAARAQCDVSASAGSVVVTGPPVPAVAANGTTYGSFLASAAWGPLAAGASVNLPENGSENGMNAIAQFTDRITITAPGVAQFTAGTLTAVIDTRGTPVVTHTATGDGVAQGISASYQLFVSVNGGTVHQLNGAHAYGSSQVPPETISGTVPAPGVEAIDINFLFGIPFTLSGFLLANSGGSNIIPVGATGALTGDAQMTFDWNGMSSIRDNGGMEYVSVATVTSCSGADWKNDPAPTGVVDPGASAPASRLEGGFPNPFRGATTIAFSVAEAGPVSLRVFDVAGRSVRTLVSGPRTEGRHTVGWDGRDDAGRGVAGGVYFVRLADGGGTDQARIVFLD